MFGCLRSEPNHNIAPRCMQQPAPTPTALPRVALHYYGVMLISTTNLFFTVFDLTFQQLFQSCRCGAANWKRLPTNSCKAVQLRLMQTSLRNMPSISKRMFRNLLQPFLYPVDLKIMRAALNLTI